MVYQEYIECIEVLQRKPGWFRTESDTALKLDVLEKFRQKGSPSEIQGLIPFISDTNRTISLRTAEVAISLFDKLKSRNQLYESLKYLSIGTSDVDYFAAGFQVDISVKLLALCTLNRNGYIRQRAVKALAKTEHQNAIRFLILRIGDWVKNVDEAATISLTKFFTDENRMSFIRELDFIEALKNIERVDTRPQYQMIIDYLVDRPLTTQFYKTLHVTDKIRLLYVKKCVERHGIDQELVTHMLSDRNFLIRIQALQYARHLDRAEQSGLILRLLNDNSSQVRLSSLYYIKAEASSYYEVILNLTSDLSASVRDLARYLLRSYQLDFRDLYRKRIASETSKVGSILGLAEIGNSDDLDVLIALLNTKDTSIKLACLNGISKIDLQQGRIYALQLISDESNRIRKRCVDILSRSWDAEVMAETERIYVNANTSLKKSILVLYNSVGGWDVLGFLIRAVSERDSELRDLGWSFLQRWRERALRLFTKPAREAIDRAKGYYESANKPDQLSNSTRQALWDEIQYYLRYD
jgi:HEAT repeat protein